VCLVIWRERTYIHSRHGVQKVPQGVCAHLCLAETPSIAIRYQKIKFVMNTPFFSFVVCQCRRISDNNQTLEILRRHDQLRRRDFRNVALLVEVRHPVEQVRARLPCCTRGGFFFSLGVSSSAFLGASSSSAQEELLLQHNRGFFRIGASSSGLGTSSALGASACHIILPHRSFFFRIGASSA